MYTSIHLCCFRTKISEKTTSLAHVSSIFTLERLPLTHLLATELKSKGFSRILSVWCSWKRKMHLRMDFVYASGWWPRYLLDGAKKYCTGLPYALSCQRLSLAFSARAIHFLFDVHALGRSFPWLSYSNDFQFDCWCVIPLRFLGCALIRNWMRTESFRPWQSFYTWIVDLICHEHTAHYNNCNSILANSILARSFRAAIWLTN